MTQYSKQKIFPGALEADYKTQLERARKRNPVAGILKKNPAVFKKREKAHQKIILDRLGWIDVVRQMPRQIARLEKLVDQAREAGVEHVFVLGMGGSSLCPEVFGKIFGKLAWLKSYTVVDTTAPSQLEAIIKATDLRKAFFIVSSKSGSTIETISQFRFFFKLAKEQRPLKAGNYFAAVTDPGSDLQRIARRNRFTEIFLNNSDIGGRYSALSFFGLVPAAFTKVNLAELLQKAEGYLDYLESDGDSSDALELGMIMGLGSVKGFDKLSFRSTTTMEPFIAWIEQLVAESTGKELKGIIPIDWGSDGLQPIPAEDRLYVHYSMKEDKDKPPMPQSISKNDIPRVTIELSDTHSLGAEIVKWEMATAVASTVLGVNPFDEPNVSESKKNTAAILEARRGHRKFVPEVPLHDFGAFTVMSVSGVAGVDRRRDQSPGEILTLFLDGVKKGDYISVLCYTEMSAQIEDRIHALRMILSEKSSAANMRGYGPRFLHSVGQLYKGGAQKGHFIVLEREYETDYEIPKMNTTFAKLIKAQAQGDIKALRKRKRPVMSINLKHDPLAALDNMLKEIAAGKVA